MVAQSETCLQGIPLIVFRQLKTKLEDLKAKNEELNARALWEHIMKCSRNKIRCLKPAAFRDDGPYLSLSMMSDHGVFEEHESKRVSSTKIISTIHNHFYYFGKQDDPSMVPFKYDGESLVHNGRKFNSHFKVFKDDVFMSMMLWMEPTDHDNSTIAANVFLYLYNLVKDTQYNLPSTDHACIQESLILWTLCNCTHRNLGSLNLGQDFLIGFIRIIQIGVAKFNEYPELQNCNI